jgi:nitrate reductase gamma subunit
MGLKAEGGPKLSYGSSKFLWLGAIAFHYCFFIILLRHVRFFTDPVPLPFEWLDKLDSILQIGVPNIYITEFIILGALTYLFLRRVCDPKLRYISLTADYFPLFLILGIVITGILMRYFIRTDIVNVKELAMGLVTFHPTIPEGIGSIFYIHIFLVCVLMAYFPWSKLMHAGGIFLSPTRNLANTNRMERHINPWNYPVKLHTYEEWEDGVVKNGFRYVLGNGPVGPVNDPVWQKKQGTRGGGTRGLLQNFDGSNNGDNSSGVAPPDTQGDVGPNHYVQMVNNVTQIFDKNGNTLWGPTNSSAFWDGFDDGTPYDNANDGDPVVLYDQQADRWLVTQFAINTSDGSQWELLAVSTSPDPTGTYYRYAFQFTDMPDYPKLGVWPDGCKQIINLNYLTGL